MFRSYLSTLVRGAWIRIWRRLWPLRRRSPSTPAEKDPVRFWADVSHRPGSFNLSNNDYGFFMLGSSLGSM
jgi:hypothetical protein